MTRYSLPRPLFVALALSMLASAAAVLLLACATVQEVLPCWVDVRVEHRAFGEEEPVTPTTLADASRVVDARLEAYGVDERTVFTWANDRVVVGLPERWASDDVLELIAARGWVALLPVPAGESAPAPGSEVPDDWEVLFGSDDIAAVRLGREGGPASLEFRFTERGSRLLDAWSRRNVGRELVVAVDGTVAFAPIVQEPIADGRMLLTGPDERRLEWLASLLSVETLPIVLEQTAVEEVETEECPEE